MAARWVPVGGAARAARPTGQPAAVDLRRRRSSIRLRAARCCICRPPDGPAAQSLRNPAADVCIIQAGGAEPGPPPTRPSRAHPPHQTRGAGRQGRWSAGMTGSSAASLASEQRGLKERYQANALRLASMFLLNRSELNSPLAKVSHP